MDPGPLWDLRGAHTLVLCTIQLGLQIAKKMPLNKRILLTESNTERDTIYLKMGVK